MTAELLNPHFLAQKNMSEKSQNRQKLEMFEL